MRFAVILALLALCVVLTQAKSKASKCQRAVASAGKGKWAPKCDKKGRFEKKQCSDKVCWCVKPRSGKPKFKKLKIPLAEDYNCKKPTKCQKERFAKLLKNPKDPSAPKCDDKGDYVKKPQPEKCITEGPNANCANMALGRRTWQSSNYNAWTLAARAVDGNTDGKWTSNSCACTKIEANPWWAVDLGASRMVFNLHITNRADCCGDRLNKIIMGVTDISPQKQVPALTNFQRCNTFDGNFPQGATKIFDCNKKGRYVIIQLQAKQYLTIGEVQVFAAKLKEEIAREKRIPEGCKLDKLRADDKPKCENVALGKMTYQSTVLANQGYSERAIDGNDNGLWAGASCSHTNLEVNPWWVVDLGTERQIHGVAITNRKDCCGDRLRNIRIGSSNVSPTKRVPALYNYDVCFNYYGVFGAGETRTFPCLAGVGRYVIVQLEQKQYLTLCEVKVFAETFKSDRWQDAIKIPSGCSMDKQNPTCTNVALNRRAFQSSNYQNIVYAGRAVDGNTDGTWARRSLSCTVLEENPWWAVDLVARRLVYRIDIFNRKDCCNDRLRYVRMGVSDKSPEEVKPALTNFDLCATSNGLIAAGASGRFKCGKRGRFVIVQLRYKQYLTLAEVLVYAERVRADIVAENAIPKSCKASNPKPTCKNIAPGRPVYQSSLYNHHSVPNAAVDGNTNGVWRALSCACTKREANPWFAVDLGKARVVYRVEIFNRKDCCPERLTDINLGVTNQDPRKVAPIVNGNYQVCARYYGQTGAGEKRVMECGLRGRYVIIQLETPGQYLTMCEVKVYGEELAIDKPVKLPAGCELEKTPATCTENVAKGRPAFQSSDYVAYTLAAKAVDGNSDGRWGSRSCACTKKEEKAWWAVDLGSSMLVYRVDVTNRGDCCPERLRNFYVGVTNDSPVANKPNLYNYDVCAINSAPIGAGATKAFACGKNGRYVIVQQIYSDYLTICEVKVYAKGTTKAPACKNKLKPAETLPMGGKLCSTNGQYTAVLQKGDGNFVIYKKGATKAVWATYIYGKDFRLSLQTDGNLVIYNAKNQPQWNTKTNGKAASHLIMQDDGNLVLYDTAKKPLWASAK